MLTNARPVSWCTNKCHFKRVYRTGMQNSMRLTIKLVEVVILPLW